jgi:hypothetical protein
MAINFPSTPSNGDIHTTSEGTSYRYDSSVGAWVLVSITLLGISANTQIIFNDGGSANGSNGLTFNKVANTLFANTISVSKNVTAAFFIGDGSALTNLPGGVSGDLAFIHANQAFAKANTANNDAIAAFFRANQTYVHANTAHASANAGLATANASIVHANLAFFRANQAFAHANAAFITGNTAFAKANTANNDAISAFLTANISYAHANASFEKANSAGGSITIYDDSIDEIRYLVFANNTTGNLYSANVSSSRLSFNPSTGVLSATIFNSTSNIEKKENIVVVTDALRLLDNIHGVRFTWKDNGYPSLGVIAQDVEKVLPELVGNDKSVNYNGIIAVLIEAIKELRQEVSNLKAKYDV